MLVNKRGVLKSPLFPIVRRAQASWVNSCKIQGYEASQWSSYSSMEWPELSEVGGRKPAGRGLRQNGFFSRKTCPDWGFLTGCWFAFPKRRRVLSPAPAEGQASSSSKARSHQGQVSHWAAAVLSALLRTLLLESQPSLPSWRNRALIWSWKGSMASNWMFLFGLCSFTVYGQKAPTNTIRRCQNKMLT